MTEVLLSKTVRLALFFAGVGLVLIVGDAAYFQATRSHLSFVIEFFTLLGSMFVAIAGKNLADNYVSYRRDSMSYQAAGPLPAAPVSQGTP